MNYQTYRKDLSKYRILGIIDLNLKNISPTVKWLLIRRNGDRINENYLYYMIAQKRIGSWPLHTKTMVIMLSDEDTIEWIKIHD